MNRIVLLFLGGILFTTSCVSISNENHSENSSAGTNSIRSRSLSDPGVYLEIVEKTQEEIVLTLNNNTGKPIFVIYEEVSNKQPDLFFVPYNLTCRKENGISKVYSPAWHALPSRKTLESGAMIKFKVDSLPIYDGVCNISIRYFDDINAVKTLEKFLNPDWTEYTNEEKKIIDKGKKNMDISFEIKSNYLASPK